MPNDNSGRLEVAFAAAFLLGLSPAAAEVCIDRQVQAGGELRFQLSALFPEK